MESRYSFFNNNNMNTYSSAERKLEQLKQQGVSVKPMILQSPLEVRLNMSERQVIPAGIRVHFIKSPRGSFIRTPDGKFFAIRQSTPTVISDPKLMPRMSAAAPPPPPLPPPPPASLSSSSRLLDELLYDTSSLSSTSTYSSLMNDLNDEIDLLINDNNSNLLPKSEPIPSTTSTAFDDFNAWHNDFFSPNDIYSDLFPNSSIMTVPTNNPNMHDFTSNSLTFT